VTVAARCRTSTAASLAARRGAELGTACAQQHLRTILGYLDMPTLGQPEAYIQVRDDTFTGDGAIGDASRAFVQGWVERYVEWVKRHNA
jgi:chromate reductase